MQLTKKRLFLLVALIIVLFVNWYFYPKTEILLRDSFSSMIDILSGWMPFFTSFNKLAKWVTIILLAAINVAISLSIIYVYFWDKNLLVQAVKMLGGYALVFFLIAIVCYYAGWLHYTNTAIAALKQLSTPLVECAMIPLLKLKNAQPQT